MKRIFAKFKFKVKLIVIDMDLTIEQMIYLINIKNGSTKTKPIL